MPLNSTIPIGADADTGPGITPELTEILDEDNLVEWLDETQLTQITSRLLDDIESDRGTMDDYLRKYNEAIRLAKMEPETEDKTFPFVGASKVMMPYLMEAAVDFNSRVVPELIGNQNPCKIRITGEIRDEVENKSIDRRADRCATAINAILTVKMLNWRDDVDRESLILPIVGTTFKKTWYDQPRKEFRSQLVYADNLIFDHSCDNFSSVPRKTQEYVLTRNEVLTAIRSGEFTNLDEEKFRLEYGEDYDESLYEFMESACDLDLDEDGYGEPYIVNIHVESEAIVSIVPRFDEEDVELNSADEVVRINGEELYSIKTFVRDPFGSCMGLGWGILLGPLYKTINTNTRQMLDAGTLNNTAANSGFMRESVQIGSMQKPGSRVRKGKHEMIMGQFTSVPGGSGPLKDDFFNLPFNGPSEALYNLMETLKAEMRDITTGASNVEVNQGQAASLYIAQLQQALKTPTAIMIRLYSGYSKEFRRIYDLISMYMEDEDYQEILNQDQASVDADFEDESLDVTTTADPTQGSEQERLAKAQALLDEAKEAPQIANLHAAYKQYFETLGYPDSVTEKVFPTPDPNQKDPMTVAAEKVAEAEGKKGDAAMLSAQVKMADAQIKASKLEVEIAEIVSKIEKNLAEADKASNEVSVHEMKEIWSTLREDIKANASNRITSPGVAGPPGNEGVSGGA